MSFKSIYKSHVEHYNPSKYWKYREIVVDRNSRVPKIIRLFMLYYIQKCNSYNCAVIATGLGAGTKFLSPPRLPHGLIGIITSPHTVIGNNVTIYQNVTIGQRNNKNNCIIGDNVMIGANAMILGDVKIGDNAKIGAGAVVVHDVPSNSTVVGNPAKVVKVSNNE